MGIFKAEGGAIENPLQQRRAEKEQSPRDTAVSIYSEYLSWQAQFTGGIDRHNMAHCVATLLALWATAFIGACK